jgi:NitT/TauT family transport system substrate-binding protein
MKAQTVATGPDADTYITKASKIVGAKPDEALAATKVIPFVSATDQTALLAKGGELEKAYALTGQFLVDQGRTKTAPSSAQITSHVDGSYAAQALKDGCNK